MARTQRWVLGGCWMAQGQGGAPGALGAVAPDAPACAWACCLAGSHPPVLSSSLPPPQLAKEFEKGIPVDESILLPRLRELLISEFGATPRQGAGQRPAAAPEAAEPAGAAA